MMPSNFTWILFFVAPCFKIAGAAFQLKDCFSDESCKDLILSYNGATVPVLLTKDNLGPLHDPIVNHIRDRSHYQILIRAFVQNNQCRVVNGFFVHGGQYPALFMLIRDFVYNDAYHPVRPSMTLERFLDVTSTARPSSYNGLGVSVELENRIRNSVEGSFVGVAERTMQHFSPEAREYLESTGYTAAGAGRMVAQKYAQGQPPGYALSGRSSFTGKQGGPSVAWTRGQPMQPYSAQHQAGPSGTHHSMSPSPSGSSGSAAQLFDLNHSPRKSPSPSPYR